MKKYMLCSFGLLVLDEAVYYMIFILLPIVDSISSLIIVVDLYMWVVYFNWLYILVLYPLMHIKLNANYFKNNINKYSWIAIPVSFIVLVFRTMIKNIIDTNFVYQNPNQVPKEMYCFDALVSSLVFFVVLALFVINFYKNME